MTVAVGSDKGRSIRFDIHAPSTPCKMKVFIALLMNGKTEKPHLYELY